MAADPEVIDPLTTDDEKVAEYADHYFEYGEGDRVVREAVEGSSRTIEFGYTEGTHAEGFNHWKRRTVESRSDGSQTMVYTNFLGQVLVKELRSPGGAESGIEHRRYDDAGRLVEIATPAAVEGYVDDAGPGENELAVTLRTDRGLIRTYAYHHGQGGPDGYLRAEGIKRGALGDQIVLKEYEYTAHSGGGRTVYPLARQVVYREEDGSGPIETTVSYTWYPNSVQVQEQVTTLPAVPVEQNGPGTSATFTHRFDAKGSLVWERDERGFITYHEYDATCGGRIRTIRDVDATRLALPSGWSTPAGGGLHLLSDFQYDELGRVVQTLGPEHEIDGRTVRRAAWTVYKDLEHEVWTARGYQSEPGNLGYGSYGPDDDFTLVNPVTIRKFGSAGRVLEEIQAVRGWTEGALSASDSFEQSDYVRWTTHRYDQHGRLVAVRAYHTIPSSGEGTAGANYDETTFGHDAMGRQNMLKSPGGTITRTVFDFQGNPVAVYVGTDDTGATDSDPTGGSVAGNNLVLVTEWQYAGPGGCTGCCGGGAGMVTAQIQHVDATTHRATQYLYDWRNRQQYVIQEADDQGRVTFTRNQYDNLDHVVRMERYHDAAGDGVDPENDPQPDDVLIARSDALYDDRGRAYRTKEYAVNPQTGAVGDAIVDNAWYDAAGNKIKDLPAGSQRFTKSVYDGLGRVTKQYRGYDLSETSHADAGTVTSDTILEQTETAYDPAGNVIFVTTRQRLHNATGSGELTSQSGAQPRARVSYVAMYQDEIGRPVATANYGTNDGMAPNRPDCIPERSDDVLVTSTEYNSAGEPFKTIDPAGREDRQFFDALGRTVKTVQNYIDGIVDVDYQDEDVTVEMTYTPNGQLSTLTAHNPTTGNQVTRYVYGTTLSDSGIARSDLLRAEIYPDSDDTADPLGDGPDEVYDRVEFRYNRQDERIEKRDQNGTVHAYDFDKLGRRIHDRVTTVGTGVDNAALRISTTYDVRGLVQKTTTYDNATVGSGNVVNEVVFEYNDSGRMVKEYQEHSGAKDANTLYIGYNYDTSASSGTFTKSLRPTSVRYPNGRLVHFTYGSSGEMNDALNRLAAINDDNSGTPGNSVAEYTYLGAGTIVVEDYPQPEVKLDYDSGTAGEYAGFDRFGRVVDHFWCDYGASVDRDRYTYGYDRASNRLYRENTTGSGKDEFYTYDGVNQLKIFDRGDLNAQKTAISGTPVREEEWTLDMTGNWSGYVQKTSGTTDLDQARVHNDVNEVTAIAATTGTNWADPVHDKSGNMTTIPKPSSLANGLTAIYDAWNRLIEVSDGLTVVARYSYDGLNRRVKKGLDSQSPSNPHGIDSYVHYFYNSGWQVLETRETATESAQTETLHPNYQYVWSPRYVDAVVLRDENTDQDSLCDDARLYYVADANFNVTALVDTAGDAVERYLYSPYGSVTIYDGTWTNTRASSGYANAVLYTGREYDPETGLYQYRNRYYSAELGRFASRDLLALAVADVNLQELLTIAAGGLARGAIRTFLLDVLGERDGSAPTAADTDLYRYCSNGPLTRIDPSGFVAVGIAPGTCVYWYDFVRYERKPGSHWFSPWGSKWRCVWTIRILAESCDECTGEHCPDNGTIHYTPPLPLPIPGLFVCVTPYGSFPAMGRWASCAK